MELGITIGTILGIAGTVLVQRLLRYLKPRIELIRTSDYRCRKIAQEEAYKVLKHITTKL